MPRITIGMPLYNNASTLAAAFEAVLAQTVSDFEIIASDDGSSDETWAICKAFAARDARIRCYRQSKNLFYLNFKFTLDQATTPYFVWLAGDDRWLPTYLEQCIAILDEQPQVVGCVAKCQFTRQGLPSRFARGTYALMGSWSENVLQYLHNPTDNTRMYGVFRTEVLQKSFPNKIIYAYDWALSAATLRFGKHYEINEVLMVRDETSATAYLASVSQSHQSGLRRIFPLLAMSIHLLRTHAVPITPRILSALLRLNVLYHAEYLRYAHPQVHRILLPAFNVFEKYLAWRL